MVAKDGQFTTDRKREGQTRYSGEPGQWFLTREKFSSKEKYCHS